MAPKLTKPKVLTHQLSAAAKRKAQDEVEQRAVLTHRIVKTKAQDEADKRAAEFDKQAAKRHRASDGKFHIWAKTQAGLLVNLGITSCGMRRHGTTAKQEFPELLRRPASASCFRIQVCWDSGETISLIVKASDTIAKVKKAAIARFAALGAPLSYRLLNGIEQLVGDRTLSEYGIEHDQIIDIDAELVR